MIDWYILLQAENCRTALPARPSAYPTSARLRFLTTNEIRPPALLQVRPFSTQSTRKLALLSCRPTLTNALRPLSETARARISAVHWDHILYTGSPVVGRQVMQAAAANLAPSRSSSSSSSAASSTDTGIATGSSRRARSSCVFPTCVGAIIAPDLKFRRMAEMARTSVIQEAKINKISTCSSDDLVRAMGISGTSASQVIRLSGEIHGLVKADVRSAAQKLTWISLPEIRLRVVNVVDLIKLQPCTRTPARAE